VKIEKKNSVYVTNIEEAQSDNFSFHDEGLIMSLIQDKMYTKKLYTPLQEVLSNARDAVRERHWTSIDKKISETMTESAIKNTIEDMYSNSRHVNITMPNGLNPVLAMRDYGVGISPERITLVKRVGLSTKNMSNVQTGGFGLGLKSIFAYAEQFYIISYYNGIEYMYVCQKNVNKMGAIVLLSETETPEENGVEIRIPIKEEDMKVLSTHISEITRFWTTKPTINGSEVKTEEKLFKFEHGSLSQSDLYNLVVVDGIQYKLDLNTYSESETATKKIKEHKVVLFFDVGEIDLVMTREGIEESKKNKEVIQKRMNELSLEISSYCRTNITSSKDSLKRYSVSYSELVRVFELNKILTSDDLKFQMSFGEFLVNIDESKVKFTHNDNKVFFDVLRSEAVNSRSGSGLREKRVVLSTVEDFSMTANEGESSFSGMSISLSESDDKINSYSERKRKEIYNLNKTSLDNGYIYVSRNNVEDKNSVKEDILKYLISEFNLNSVSIVYPDNLSVLNDLDVFYYNKRDRRITRRKKSFKVDGKTKFKRYQSTINGLSDLCRKIEDKYSVDKERFFNLMKMFDMEIVFSKENYFPLFEMEMFDKLFLENISKIVDEDEVNDYFVNIKLKNVQKTRRLWVAISKNNVKQIPLINDSINDFIVNELNLVKEPKSTYSLTSQQSNTLKSKTTYYENLFNNNKDIYEKTAMNFINGLKLEQTLENHPIVKNTYLSYYSCSDGSLLVNNCINYINTFFEKSDVFEDLEKAC
jgi:hypothetical protein